MAAQVENEYIEVAATGSASAQVENTYLEIMAQDRMAQTENVYA